MKYVFLHTHKQSQKCILFFGGFGSRAEQFAHLDAQCNVILVYDYRDFKLPQSFYRAMSAFSEVILIAFSMGVSIAPFFVSSLSLSKKIAINGTNVGIDRVFGIHPAIFKKSIAHFDWLTFQKALVGGEEKKLAHFLTKQPKNEELQEELQSIFDFLFLAHTKTNNAHFIYDDALLSSNDTIFPLNAAQQFFASFSPSTHIHIIQGAHFVFFDFCSWEELCCI